MSDNESKASQTDRVSRFLSGSRIVLGLSMLYEAEMLARETRTDSWQFAVEIGELCTAGLQHADLRWLASEGYVEHAEETTRPSDPKRDFVRVGSLSLGPSTCFVLTSRGLELAQAHSGSVHRAARITDVDSQRCGKPGVCPVWDGYRRELRVQDRLIKKFRLPAENQERILAAFQEDGWPARIDDPLSRAYEIDPKCRLHESIRALNRNQTLPLLRFSGDGTGQGVLWSFATQSALSHRDDLPTIREHEGRG